MNPRNRAFFECIAVVLAATSAGLMGCEGGTDNRPTTVGPYDYISDNPRANGAQNGEDDAEGGSGTGTTTGGGDPTAPADDPERAITEADIIQVHEGKLYALSQYSGLSIIDISIPDQLTLLGRYDSAGGVPFEMYLRDGVVYAMFNSWGQYVWDAASGTYSWVQTSHLEALDVEDPASIVPIGSFDLPGAISDSRIVGDVLYTVTFEDGWCWDCDPNPNTTITSLNVANPATINVVDQLSFADNDPYGYGWRRSVSATSERMYVAGIEWDGNDEGHSTIQVVDISDPGGDLVLGASVEAEGQIESRWQMDEYQGVLRVVSQPGIWWSNANPAVQTFTVVSSQEIVPLGYTELQIPMPETLRSVRFDGPRGYAITAEQTDPLYTIDLSNPAQPQQLGELVIPGWVYHMEPRGNRILALGFDNAASEGSLNVSLFDVSDMTQPTMIERVHFGGSWSSVAEDQDRIHKAFTILDQLGLIMVPYSGWSYDEQDPYGCGSYHSGIQLVDFTENSLTKRGVAPSRGNARRAFVDGGRVFAVSDEEVRTFDITNRDAPSMVTSQKLATVANQSALVGDVVVRLAADWWTTEARLEVVPAATPSQAQPIGTLDLASLVGQDNCYGWGLYGARLFAHEQHVYLVWPSPTGESLQIAAVDLTNPANPTIVGELDLQMSAYDMLGYYYSGAVVNAGEPVVQVGSTLVFRRSDEEGYGYYEDYYGGASDTHWLMTRNAWLEVVDLSNPAQPTHAATVTLPKASGHGALQVNGTQVLTSHWVPLPADMTKARFYFDRIDVSDPSAPSKLPPVNVPGSLVSFDGGTGRLLTMDYQRLITHNVPSETCWETWGWDAMWEPNSPDHWEGLGTCTGIRRSFKLAQVMGNVAALLETNTLDDGTSVYSVLVGDDRVFATAQNRSWYEADTSPYWSGTRLFVVGGMRDGALEIEEVSSEELGYTYPVAAAGKRLVSSGWSPSGVWTLDASDLGDLAFEQKAELRSYINHVSVAGDKALCSLGAYGLVTVDLDD